MPAIHSATNSEGVAHDVDALRKEIASLKEGLANLSQLLLHRGSDGAAEASQQIAEVGKRALATMRARPLLSMLAAFMVGIVFGRFFVRK